MPSLIVNGQTVPCGVRTISGSIDSPYLKIRTSLVRPADAARFPRDTRFTTDFYGTQYTFVADTRNFSNAIDDDGSPLRETTLEGSSPLALLGPGRALNVTYEQDVAMSARALVESFIGATTWSVLDWAIPAGRFSVDGISPLAAAQVITEAIGAFISSNPDGSHRVEYLSPGNTLDWDIPDGELTLTAADLSAVSEQSGLPLLWDRVTVRDFDAGPQQDALDWVADEGDPTGRSGVIRAYPNPWRSNVRIRSTRNGVTTGGGSVRTRTETEDVVFEAGRASTQYPIYSISSVDWLDDNLGSLTYEQYNSALTSSTGNGYSMATVRYVVRSINFNVSSSSSQTAQLILAEY